MHAFLVMVHENSYSFFQNLKLMDSPEVDIYIHVDKKCNNFDYIRARNIIKLSELNFIANPVDVKWGGYSQILAELLLLKIAMQKKEYDYFHLISGSDLLITPVDDIISRCDNSQKAIFLDCRKITKKDDIKLYQRVATPHVMVDWFGNKSKLKSLLARGIDKVQTNYRFFVLRQDEVYRRKLTLFFGANWFSLPRDVVEYLLDQEPEIKSIFSNGRNVDELFVQTILGNVEAFKRRIVKPQRFIDWSAGLAHPKTLTMDDYQRIMTSNAFFARKFDSAVDREVIDKIVLDVMNESQV